jgi:hypothetical protein
MPDNAYHFVTRWRVEGTCGEVADILGDPLQLTKWWPSVYLAVNEIEPGDENDVGRRVRVHTKGWLPYTLRWQFVVVESRYPNGFTLDASGDFEGRGIWTFDQDGAHVDVTYDWSIRAEKPLLRHFSLVFKPLFAANHRWAMAQGETSLKLELDRRRAVSDVERAAVPPPPGPVTYAGVALVTVGVIAAASLFILVRQSRSKHRR